MDVSPLSLHLTISSVSHSDATLLSQVLPGKSTVLIRLRPKDAAGFILLCLGWPVLALAEDWRIDGYVDLRAEAPASDATWREGGFGKTRYSGSQPETVIGGALLEPSWQILPDLRAVVDLQYNPTTRDKFGVIDAYLRYRPVSTSPWRWSVKAGMFFAPISQENDSLGWSNPWTITSSALNSWVGEELRTIGIEPSVEWRDAVWGTARLFGAVFGDNETAGTLLGLSGWNLSDSITPLGGRVSQPNFGGGAQLSPVFQQIDGNPGWYGGASVTLTGYGQLTVMRYDNNVDVAANYVNTTWHTRFWSAGANSQWDHLTLLAQVMSGETSVADSPTYTANTTFSAAYLLAGWQWDDWRLAARIEHFLTGGYDHFFSADYSEHGLDETLALSWRPRAWLRLTAEYLHVDSTRQLRLIQNIAPRQIDNQEQLMARFFF